jgi:hypothetical protein
MNEQTDAEPWWYWRWDRDEVSKVKVSYEKITRWRRGWVTLYKFEADKEIEWKLYLPFNISIGIGNE